MSQDISEMKRIVREGVRLGHVSYVSGEALMNGLHDLEELQDENNRLSVENAGLKTLVEALQENTNDREGP